MNEPLDLKPEWATPQWIMGVAKLLDHEAYILKTTARKDARLPDRLRAYADILEGRT